MEADVQSDTKTCKRTEDAAADRVMSGDSSFALVDPDPMCLPSFGDYSTETPSLPYRDDAMFDKGAAAPKPCLSPVEMHTPTAAGGLLTAGTASTAMMTIFSRPLPSWTLGEETMKSTSRTNNQMPPSAGRELFKQDQDKLWCLTLAVVQVAYAAVRFCESGTRCVSNELVWTLQW